MALVTPRHMSRHPLGATRNLFGLAACLMVGGCAQVHFPGGPDPLTLDGAKAEAPKDAPKEGVPQEQSDLVKATDYWGKQYAENPRDLKIALNLARNLKAMGEKQRALAVLQHASIFHGESRELASEYGRLALDLDQVGLADKLLAAADDPVHPDWRVVSARGTVFAKQGKYAEAIPFYDRALTLAHDQPSVLSNLALATAMSGNPARAETLLRRAETADGSSPKIRQNLALVLGLQGKYDEAKLIGARDIPMESAAENTSMLRRVVKLEPKGMPRAADDSIDTAEQWSAKNVHVAKGPEKKTKTKPAAEALAAATTTPKSNSAPVAAPPAALPWSSDLKQADATPAPTPTPIAAAAEAAPIWTADVAAPAKIAKPEPTPHVGEVTHHDVDLSLHAPKPASAVWKPAETKPAAAKVAHRDVDLSLRAPEPAKKPDTAAVIPGKGAAPAWTPQVAASGTPGSN